MEVSQKLKLELPYDPAIPLLIHIKNKMHTFTHNGILLSHKKEQNIGICSNMDGLGGKYTMK